MAAAPGPPVPQTSASPALPLPTEPVQVPAAFSLWLPGLHRCEGAGFMEPPPLLRLGRRAGICALHPTLSAPGSSPPPSPPPPPARVCGRRGGGSWLAAASCPLSASGGLEARVSISCCPCGHQTQQGLERVGSAQPGLSAGRGAAGQGDGAGAPELSGSGRPPEGWGPLTPLTVGAFTAWAADAQVPGDAVLAGAPVQARLGSALVDF